MRKILLVITLLYGSNFAKAQNLTVDELIAKANCKSFECFNEFIVPVGFSFIGAEDKDEFSVYKYSTQENSPQNNVTYILFKSKRMSDIEYHTTDRRQYLEFLAGVKKFGFDVLKTVNNDHLITTTYQSKQYPKTDLYISVVSEEFNGKKWTEYRIRIFTYS